MQSWTERENEARQNFAKFNVLVCGQKGEGIDR